MQNIVSKLSSLYRNFTFLILMAVILGTGFLYWKYFRGVFPVIAPPVEVSGELQDILTLADGFYISILSDNVPDARVIVFDEFGDMWVSQTKSGKISKLTLKNGVVAKQETVFEGLQKPHGLAFDLDNPSVLYIAEENRLSKVRLNTRDREFEEILTLPSEGGHFTRTIAFGPDKRLYISIGSSCNVCNEKDERRAKIFSIGKGAGDMKTLATGLRNTVFFTWHPKTREMWGADIGRDLLGDDVPPDEINIIREGGFYGWPICYGKNIHDIDFDKKVYVKNQCQAPFETPSYIDIPAHSSPLGLSFVPENSAWPDEYWNNLIVAYHGSWNRTEPTGYKLARIVLDQDGKYLRTEDFISGWLTDKGVLGRPVYVIFYEGALYVSDDKAGMIYKIIYKN